MGKRIVITVHGVNPNRLWQPSTHRVLEPHFKCEAVSYYQYDKRVGVVRTVVNLGMFVLALAFLLGAAIWTVYAQWAIAVACGAAFVICLLVSLGAAWRKRVNCAAFLKQEIDRISPIDAPNVIAHSLGTYLFGSVLRKFPDLRFSNVVLVSSVLPPAFPWKKILSERAGSVSRVRNEFGTADYVVKLVGRLQWLIRDLGNSGSVGFRDDSELVHTSHNPMAPCSLCASAPAKIHNISIEEFAHSDEFLGPGHARKLWLPFLWGFSSEEFLEYLELCQEASRLQRSQLWLELDPVIDRLWARSFTWTDDKSLSGYVSDYIGARLRRRPFTVVTVAQVIDDVKSVLHIVTDEACAESLKETDLEEGPALGLHPRIAIVRAVERIANEYENQN